MSSIGAAVSGNRYQSRLFWYFASQLLYDDGVTKAELESTTARVFDDILLRYGVPKLMEGDHWISADYYQIKYHVDQTGSLTTDGFIDPDATATKDPLLKRFFKAHQKIVGNGGARLNLVTNWSWHPDDLFTPCWRRSRFSAEHVEKTAGAKAAFQKWLQFLGCKEDELNTFLRFLRIQAGWADLDQSQQHLNDRLRLAGLKPLEFAAATSPYDDLGMSFMERGLTEFTRESLLKECQRAELVAGTPTLIDSGKTIAIRSFADGAQDVQAAIFIDLVELFPEKRKPRDANVWKTEALAELKKGLSPGNLSKLQQPFIMRLDCQISVAFAAGRMLPPKAGYQVDILQKGRNGSELWTSADGRGAIASPWKVSSLTEKKSPHLVLSVAVSRDVHRDVESYAKAAGLQADILCFSTPELGQTAIRDSGHAWALAESFVSTVRDALRDYAERPKLHLFFSGPNALAFRMGQEAGILGDVQMYEFDFEGVHKYAPSLLAPAVSR